MFTSSFTSITSRRKFFKNTTSIVAASLASSTQLDLMANNLLDFNDPYDNLYAFGKLWGSYDDKPTYGGYEGVQFARIGTNRLIPLFGYTGFGNMQSKINDDKTINVRGTEGGYFTDLNTGKIIDHWKNPWTGETVDVFPFINKKMRGHLTAEMPTFAMGNINLDQPTLMNEAEALTKNSISPFILPWKQLGDQYLLSWEYSHEYSNPVTKEKWPKAHTTSIINPSEHFSFYTPIDKMNDKSVPSSPFHAGFMRTSPWWPWMKMGQTHIDGCLFGRMHSYQITGTLDDIPRGVLERVEKDHPEILEVQSGWGNTIPKGTWEAYAEEVPPEVK